MFLCEQVILCDHMRLYYRQALYWDWEILKKKKKLVCQAVLKTPRPYDCVLWIAFRV